MYIAKQTFTEQNILTINFKTQREILFYYFVIILISLGVYLSRYSPDYENYIAPLNISFKQFDIIKFEPTFWGIVYINQILFGANRLTFYAIYEICTTILFITAIKKYSCNYSLSLLIFILLFFPNNVIIQIRQGVAIGIFLHAIDDILKRRPLNYFLKIVIAVLFHYSSVFLFTLYLLKPNKINKIFYFLLPFIGFVASYTIISLEFLENNTFFLPSFLSFKFTEYINALKLYGETISINRINLINMFSLTLIVVYYFIFFLLKIKSKIYIMFFKLLGVSIFCWFFFSKLPVVSFRITNYLNPVVIFLLPLICNKFKEKNIVSIFIVIYVVILFINIYIRHGSFGPT